MYTHWHRGLNPFWPHLFGLKPLLGLEPVALIRPQLLVSHANHSSLDLLVNLALDVRCGYICIYVCIDV